MAKKRGIGLGKDFGPKRKAYQLAMTMQGLSESDPRIKDYLETGGINLDPVTQAWCAQFVNASLAQAGLKGTGSGAARSFLNYGEPVLTPKRGDIAVFARRPDDPDPQAKSKGHAGFYMGERYPGYLDIMGGNQGDAANVMPIESDRLLGFRRPPGTEEPPETPSLAASLSPRTTADMGKSLRDLDLPGIAVTGDFDLPGGLGGTVTPKLDAMYWQIVNAPRFMALADAPNASLPTSPVDATLLRPKRKR